MVDVLSQNEIDQLLVALDTGEINIDEVREEANRKIKNYDFRRPNKFNKDQVRTLHVVYEYFARLLTNFLSGVFRAYCSVELTSIEEQIFDEFNNSLPDPVILGVFQMPPLQGSLLMEVSRPVAYGMIDRILGGAGHNTEENREYTEIELALLERIISHILRLFKDPWSNIVSVEPNMEGIETNSRFMHILSPNETVAIITLKANIGDVEGVINICMPHISIKPLEDQMSSKVWFSSTKHEEEEVLHTDEIVYQIKDSSVEIRAVLGDTYINTQEVVELQKGDVVQLNSKITDNVKIFIGDLVKYSAVPGISSRKISVKIMSNEGEVYDE